MITKAIVEQLVDSYNVRVRIPIIDRTPQSNIYTPTKNLNIATICTIPGCAPNLQVGDVVIVALDDTLDEKVVILGHCYRNTPSSTKPDITCSTLTATEQCTLPVETTIGNVSGVALQRLDGVTDNVQRQLNSLLERVKTLEKQILELSGAQ